ncbi:LptF/LptG family permease [Candidatus Saganbacteria bacterium]|nr:LptF/LptG family permease [Candidatus Saganbacteria bacterium]
MKILDRYLTREVLGPFILGILGFVMVMTVDLLFTFVDLIINRGVPLGVMGQLLLYKLPSIMIMTFPVAMLFGVTMCLGRLSHDNELSALRTSGVPFTRIAYPILIISLLVSLFSFYLNEKVVPFANHESEKLIRQILMKSPLPDIRSDLFFKDAYNRHFYIGSINVKTHELQNIMVYELAGENLPQVVTARTAKLDKLKLKLHEGVIHKFDADGRLAYEAAFKDMQINMNEDPANISEQRTPQEMDSAQLSSQIRAVQKGGMSTNALATDLYMKYSVPLTSFIFALIGLPLAIPGVRSNRTWGMVVTIVMIFTFYVFASVFRSLGRGGILTPPLAAWTPQLIFGILGVILIVREVRHR